MADHADEHIIEAIGKCRIVIQNGKVVFVGDPIIADCPLAKRFAFPVPEISKESVQKNIEHRIKSFGMCTPAREVMDIRPFVGFGASELLRFGIHAGLFDAAVLACDGAGTVIAPNPALVQGIGGRMSGIVRTIPYREVISRIEQNGGYVLDHMNGCIDQMAGVVSATERGFTHIAATVADPGTAEAIRKIHPGTFIVAVHVSGLTHDEARRLVAASDLVTACASKPIREIAGAKALVQAGISIPVFAMTKRAKDLIIEKIRQGNEPVFIKPTHLPVAGEKEPEPLI